MRSLALRTLAILAIIPLAVACGREQVSTVSSVDGDANAAPQGAAGAHSLAGQGRRTHAFEFDGNLDAAFKVVAGKWSTRDGKLSGRVQATANNFAMLTRAIPDIPEQFILKARLALKVASDDSIAPCVPGVACPQSLRLADPVYTLFDFQDAANYRWVGYSFAYELRYPDGSIHPSHCPNPVNFGQTQPCDVTGLERVIVLKCQIGEATGGQWRLLESSDCAVWDGGGKDHVNIVPDVRSEVTASLRVTGERATVFLGNSEKVSHTFSSPTVHKSIGVLTHSRVGAEVEFLRVFAYSP